MKLKKLVGFGLSFITIIGVLTGCSLKKEPWTEEDIKGAATAANMVYMDAAELKARNDVEPITDETIEQAAELGLDEVIYVIQAAIGRGAGGLVYNETAEGPADTLIGVVYCEDTDKAHTVFNNIKTQIENFDFGNIESSSTVSLKNSGKIYKNGDTNVAYVTWNQNYVVYQLYFAKENNTGNLEVFFDSLA